MKFWYGKFWLKFNSEEVSGEIFWLIFPVSTHFQKHYVYIYSKKKFSFCLFYSHYYSGNKCFCFNGDGGEAREPLLLPFYWQNVSNDLSCLIPDQRKVFINFCWRRVRAESGEVTRTGFCAFTEKQKADLNLSTCWFIKSWVV